MLSTNIMGIDIINPIIIASGPWVRGLTKLKKALSYDAGALITETIVSEPYPDTSPRFAYDKNSKGFQNIRLYSGLDLENWLSDLEEINKSERYGSKTKIIVSIMGNTPSELRYISKKVERAGVDGIELGFACPMGEGPEIFANKPERVYEYTKEVVDTVNIPVSVKINANVGNLPEIVKSIENAGAAGISAIDTIRCILGIDTETGIPILPTYGGYSGVPIKPISLATVAGIVQSTKLPVVGIGGIQNHLDLIEYIMVGASSCGIGTRILLEGYDVIKDITEGLERWLKERDIKSLNEIRGKALSHLKSFEEIKIELKRAELIKDCNDLTCVCCQKSCMEDAILRKDDELLINDSLCNGCGTCLSVCPQDLIRLTWK